MSEAVKAFIADRFAEQHGAQPCMNYDHWHVVHAQGEQPMAALAVRPASDQALFLETYLNAPIEQAVSGVLGYTVPRDAIVEIGCLAALPTSAMLTLWNATAGSLVGQFLLSRKKLENWLVWIAVDVLYVGLYLYKHLTLTAILYALFVLMAMAGWRSWQRALADMRR